LGQEIKRLNDARGDFYGLSGRLLTAEELSQSMDEPLARIRRALRSSVPVGSLDPEREGETPPSDHLPDPRARGGRDEPSGPSLRRRLAALLAFLPERDRRVLELRYGLDGSPPRTLEELSGLFSVSRERVRQIQVRALERLRAKAERSRLGAYLG